MGRVLVTLLIIGVIIWSITSACTRLYTDPFGMTTREEVRSHTAIETTRLETQAAVDIANVEAFALIESTRLETHAQIESTRLMADAAKVQAQEQRQAAQAWANILPMLMLIVAGGGAIWLFIVYHGRMMLVLAENGILFPYFAPTTSRDRQRPKRRATGMSETESGVVHEEVLRHYASTHNLNIRTENGYYLLIDQATQRVVKQLVLRNE